MAGQGPDFDEFCLPALCRHAYRLNPPTSTKAPEVHRRPSKTGESEHCRLKQESRAFEAWGVSKCPAQQCRPNGEPRSDRREKHQASLLQFAFLDGRMHGQRYRPRRRIAVPIDVDDHAFRTQPQPFGRRIDDAKVGLVWDEDINIGPLQPMPFQQRLTKLRLLAYGKLKNLLSVLVHVVHLLLERFLAGRMQASSPGHVQEVPP